MNRPFLSQNWPGSSAAPWARAAAATVARRSERLRSAVSPRAFPPSTRAALDFSLPQMLGLCSALATGTCRSRTRLRPAVIERSQRGFLQSRGGAQRTAARVGSSLPRPRAREGGGTEPQGGHAQAPARSARASGGENLVTAFALSISARAPSRLLSGGRAPSPNLFFLFGPQNPASSHGFYEIPSAHVGIKQAVLLVSWIRRAA